MTVQPRLSIITPAWNEAENLPVLHERLRSVLDTTGMPWEWIIVDDHSRDRTFEIVGELAARDQRVRGIRFARNAGSHVAIACGIDEARGDAAVILAADLQDPPETLPQLLARWTSGAQVVWAARRVAPGQRASNPGFSSLYYWMMRRVLGLTDMPATGADFFLIDRVVIDAFRQCREQRVSVLALITWLGFTQDRIEYEKQPRLHGSSGWSVGRKVRLVVDSLTAFSNVPVTLCWALGAAMVLVVIVLAAVGAFGGSLGVLTPAAVVLVASVVGVGGLVVLALAAIGEYVWRALDESRRRPRYIVQARTPAAVPHETARTVP